MAKTLHAKDATFSFISTGSTHSVTMTVLAIYGRAQVELTGAEAHELGQMLMAYSVLVSPPKNFTEVKS